MSKAGRQIPMMRLDPRLEAVASQIRSRESLQVHADIGSDHGHLLKSLLESDSIERGIAIENKSRPYENSVATLRGLNADVRLANGLNGLAVGEASSLSICGMGGVSIVRILEAHPDRIPASVVLQSNRRADLVRRWGFENGFHLSDEIECYGKWNYSVQRFERSDEDDPVYVGLEMDAAILFGPHNIRRRMPEFLANLREQQSHLLELAGKDELASRKFAAIQMLLFE